MPYSELKPGRLRFEDESTGNARLLIQDNDDLKYADGAGTVIQLLSNLKSGTKAARPSAGLKGRIYFATDTGEWFYDDGSNWHRIACGGDFIGDADLDTKFETERSADEDIVRAKAGGQDIFEGYSSGIIRIVKNSDCSVYRTTDLTVSHDTWTQVTDFDGTDWDNQSEFDLTNGKFTATKPGKYLVYMGAAWGGNSTGRRGVRLYKNGSTYSPYHLVCAGCGDPIYFIGRTLQVPLDAGDYLEFYVYQDSGVNVSLMEFRVRIIKIA